MILFEALALYCDLYNDNIFEGTFFNNIQPSHLNFEDIIGLYFWDTDFLFEQETINNLAVELKDERSISSDAFSIANHLRPHADELMTTEAYEFDSEEENLFKNGKPYPYFKEFDE